MKGRPSPASGVKGRPSPASGVNGRPPLAAIGVGMRLGGRWALRGVDLAPAPGDVTCVFGADGAGKTALLRVLAGVLRPSEGRVDVVGDRHDTVGYLAAGARIYPDLTVAENADFFCSIAGASPERRHELLRFAELADVPDRLGGALSGGMRQRLALACALAGRPRVLLLDEPTTGLDPILRRRLWTQLFGLARDGVAVCASTPYVDEAARCDRLVLLVAGRVVTDGPPDDLVAAVDGRVLAVAAAPTDRPARLRDLEETSGVAVAYALGEAIRVVTTGPAREVAASLGGEPVAADLGDALVETLAERAT